MAIVLAMPALAEQKQGEGLNTSQIVVGHIKDSYDWHVTDIGTKHIVINLPVIVKSSTGWHVFSTSQFTEDADANGYRKGPFNLAIATTGSHAGKIVELQNGKETMPIMEVGDTQLIRNLLCQGLGISYLPEFVVAEDLAKGNLVSLPMTEIHPDIWRQLLYHRNKWISPELKCVIKYLQEE